MCLLAVYTRALPEAAVLVAANREERFDRPATAPKLHDGAPRTLCGVDEQAGGTWLGVNEHGVLVAVSNRPKRSVPPAARSRGLLCRELLECASAQEAAQRAFAELGTGHYAGSNYICLDAAGGTIVQGGDRHLVLDLAPGLHLVTNGDVDDPDDVRLGIARRVLDGRPLDSVADFVDRALAVCPHPRIVVRRPDGGTVSSQIVALAPGTRESIFLHAPGPPDRTDYENLSPLLQELLS